MRVDSGDLASIRAARRYVEREVLARGAAPIADDATLAAAELLANAVQHGAAPISIAVSGDRRLIRIEVRDGDSRPPIRPAASETNMTGRGLALVEAVASRWGTEHVPGGGKIVWAEFEPAAERAERTNNSTTGNADTTLAPWPEPPAAKPGDVPHHTVILGDVPTEFLLEAKAHIDNLVREFTLAESASDAGDADPGRDLARLIQTVVYEFAEARDAIKRQALAAAQRGESRTRLSLHLPASAADAGEAYLAALNEADEYARAARLLTLETPPAHQLFRQWYVGAVVRQLREITDGRQPAPVITFEARMLEEFERLATLQRITDRAARLQRVTAALANARTPEDVAGVVVFEGVAALEASGGGLLTPAEDGEHITVPGAVGYADDLVGALREERLDAPLPAAMALRSGDAVWLESRAERDRLFPALRGFESSTVSMCAVPLVVAGRIVGALRFSFSTRRLFDDDERAFVLALAAQTAQTLLRTESYAAERVASLNLQRALLPAETPAIPGWDVAAHYSPAGEQEAGGDFYDVLPLGDGRFVAVVGDVMGRGVEAAAAMAEVRTMIRAYAIDDPTPTVVFAKVDRFFRATELAQLVTVIYFLVDAATGDVTIVNAGHLPPILVDDSGSRLIEVASGTPLGVDSGERVATTVTVRSGSALLVLTDGLVERRGEDIDVGIARVLAAAATGHGPDRNARQLLRHAVDTATPVGAQDDDVTVLVLRRQ